MKIPEHYRQSYVLHLAQEQGYEGVYDEEAIKTFITEVFDVHFVSDSTTYRRLPHCASFKPNPDEVQEFRLYARNLTYLLESVLFRIKNGEWKRKREEA